MYLFYIQLSEHMEPIDMLNDFYLGLSVVALGMIIWSIILLVKDPKGVVKAALFNKK